jgi:hypothetical protein
MSPKFKAESTGCNAEMFPTNQTPNDSLHTTLVLYGRNAASAQVNVWFGKYLGI